MKNEFYVLMHGDTFVDERLLFKGIYEAINPAYILREEKTIEELVLRKKEIFNTLHLSGYNNISQNTDLFFDNLRKCKLVKFQLTRMVDL